MPDLLRRPTAQNGKVHAISPESAGWSYVGFDLYHLAPGEAATETTGDREAILVLVEGKAEITAAGQGFGEMGDRMNVFDKRPPHCLYVPGAADWAAVATTPCTLAVCSAPALGDFPVRNLGPDGIEMVPRGQGSNLRHIHNIAMEEREVAGSLLVTEVYTPAGNWSSYPSHRHDEDDFPRITYLEETYYHRLNPANGFGMQRVYTDDLSLDAAMAVQDGDVVLVPKGHHPCAAPYGVEMYYLNVMAGPRRNWRFQMDPNLAWIAERDAKG